MADSAHSQDLEASLTVGKGWDTAHCSQLAKKWDNPDINREAKYACLQTVEHHLAMDGQTAEHATR